MEIILTTEYLPFSWSSIFWTSSEPDYCPWWPSFAWCHLQAWIIRFPQGIWLLVPELCICHFHHGQGNTAFSTEVLCCQVCPPWLSPPGQPEERKQKCGCFPTLLREPWLITYFGCWTLKELSKWTIRTSEEAAVISLVLQQIHGSFPRVSWWAVSWSSLARAHHRGLWSWAPGGNMWHTHKTTDPN